MSTSGTCSYRMYTIFILTGSLSRISLFVLVVESFISLATSCCSHISQRAYQDLTRIYLTILEVMIEVSRLSVVLGESCGKIIGYRFSKGGLLSANATLGVGA